MKTIALAFLTFCVFLQINPVHAEPAATAHFLDADKPEGECDPNREICVIPIFMMPADSAHTECYASVEFKRMHARSNVKMIVWALIDGKVDTFAYQFVSTSPINLKTPGGFKEVGSLGEGRRFHAWKPLQQGSTESAYEIVVLQYDKNTKKHVSCAIGDPVIAND